MKDELSRLHVLPREQHASWAAQLGDITLGAQALGRMHPPTQNVTFFLHTHKMKRI